jgi:serine-type D-Ala-D-Ala carboxypeptidase (penicillin-binding protein 5/6)
LISGFLRKTIGEEQILMKKTITDTYIRIATVVIAAMTLFIFTGASFADEIDARAAVLIDGQSGKILFAKNPNARLQPASTTKLVTAMVTLDSMDPETVVTISKNAAMTPSVSPRLRVGEKLTIRDLLSLALIRSVNSAAVALAEATAGSEDRFVRLMNDKVQTIGADNTMFINASGLPGEGQHITAFDLALIMKEALRYPVIREIINTRTSKVFTEDGRGLMVRNTNHMLWNDEDVVGGKTGFTRSAGHCLAFAVQKGDTTLVATLLGETNRSKIWTNSSTLLAFGDDVLTGKRQPQIYYTVDAEAPFMLAAKRKSYDKRGKYKHLVSKKKVTKERARAEYSQKKNAKKAIAQLKNKKKTAAAKKGKRKTARA